MYEDPFRKNPRSYALQLAEEGLVNPIDLLTAALNFMSYDEVRAEFARRNDYINDEEESEDA